MRHLVRLYLGREAVKSLCLQETCMVPVGNRLRQQLDEHVFLLQSTKQLTMSPLRTLYL
jgi:hypothetical protein